MFVIYVGVNLQTKIVESLLHICFQKMFTGIYSKKIYQYSCLKALKFLHYVITMPAF